MYKCSCPGLMMEVLRGPIAWLIFLESINIFNRLKYSSGLIHLSTQNCLSHCGGGGGDGVTPSRNPIGKLKDRTPSLWAFYGSQKHPSGVNCLIQSHSTTERRRAEMYKRLVKAEGFGSEVIWETSQTIRTGASSCRCQ